MIIWLALLGASSGVSAQQGPMVGYAVDVPVDLAEAWRLWTEPSAIGEWFSPSFAVDIRPGGPFEIYFDPTAAPGDKGCEGCTVLVVDPEKMLSFAWNLPPAPETLALRESGHMTVVQIRFEAIDDARTRVSLLNTV